MMLLILVLIFNIIYYYMQTRKRIRRKTFKRKTLNKKSKRLSGNYNLIRGKFNLSSDIKSQHKTPVFVFGNHQWGRLTNWIASETLIKPTFDIDKLIENMSNQDINIAGKAKNEFNRKVSRAIILGEGDRQYMFGETLSNFPKIKINSQVQKYNENIELSLLVKIIMDHREKLKSWKLSMELKRKKTNTSKAAENIPPKAAENRPLKISPNSVPNNWEDLE